MQTLTPPTAPTPAPVKAKLGVKGWVGIGLASFVALGLIGSALDSGNDDAVSPAITEHNESTMSDTDIETLSLDLAWSTNPEACTSMLDLRDAGMSRAETFDFAVGAFKSETSLSASGERHLRALMAECWNS